MKKDRRSARICAVLLAALLSVCPLSGCDSESDLAENSGVTTTIPSDDPDDEDDDDDDEDDEDGADTDKKNEKDDKNDKKNEDKKKPDADSSGQSGTEPVGTDVTGGGASEGTQAPASATDAQDAQGGQSSAASSAASTSSTKQTSKTTTTTKTTAQTSASTSTTEETPKVKETKYIYLQGNSAQYQGTGITVSGSTITITKGGIYQISGTLSDGQIYIMTDDKKVYLQLAGCDITNQAGSAINCQQVKKLTIQTMPGTVNTISDGGTHDADKGAIFTEDTIIFEGEGTLNINGRYAHGVQSDDDIIINSGIINITSTKSGLHCNDGIDINGGTLFCDGGTNGIKTDGYININGGESIFIGGVREEKGAIYCDGTFAVNGGTVYAIGNTCTMPDNSACGAPVMGAVFSAAQPANTLVQFAQAGNTIAAFTSPRSFKYVVYAGPNLNVNTEYTVSYGGSVSGGTSEHYVTKGGAYSGGTDGGKLFTGSVVTFYQVP